MSIDIRRHYTANIKRELWKEIAQTLEEDSHRAGIAGVLPWRIGPRYESEKDIKDLVRRTMRNEGRDRNWHCRCDWCIDSKLVSTHRVLERMEDEMHDYSWDDYSQDDDWDGAVTQLGECNCGTVEVEGSSPSSSTKAKAA